MTKCCTTRKNPNYRKAGSKAGLPGLGKAGVVERCKLVNGTQNLKKICRVAGEGEPSQAIKGKRTTRGVIKTLQKIKKLQKHFGLKKGAFSQETFEKGPPKGPSPWKVSLPFGVLVGPIREGSMVKGLMLAKNTGGT